MLLETLPSVTFSVTNFSWIFLRFNPGLIVSATALFLSDVPRILFMLV